MGTKYQKLGEALVAVRDRMHERRTSAAKLVIALKQALALDLGLSAEEVPNVLWFTSTDPEASPGVHVNPIAGLVDTEDGYRIDMVLVVKEAGRVGRHHIAFQLRIEEVGGSVFKVHLGTDSLPTVQVDAGRPETFSEFSDAIYNTIMRYYDPDQPVKLGSLRVPGEPN